MDRLYILAIAFILAGALSGLLSGGLFQLSGAGGAGFAVVNRLTGSVWFCGIGSCTPYRYDNRD